MAVARIQEAFQEEKFEMEDEKILILLVDFRFWKRWGKRKALNMLRIRNMLRAVR